MKADGMSQLWPRSHYPGQPDMAIAGRSVGPILKASFVHERAPHFAWSLMSVAGSKRKWYRLHASTWVVALLAVGPLVLLVVPGAFASSDWPYKVDHYQHGWPWPFLEFSSRR